MTQQILTEIPPTEVEIAPVGLQAILTVPENATGMIIFAHGSGSGRLSPRNNYVASALREDGFATLLLDLLTPEEEMDRANIFDIGLLASRLSMAARWIRSQKLFQPSPLVISERVPEPALHWLQQRGTNRMLTPSFRVAAALISPDNGSTRFARPLY